MNTMEYLKSLKSLKCDRKWRIVNKSWHHETGTTVYIITLVDVSTRYKYISL